MKCCVSRASRIAGFVAWFALVFLTACSDQEKAGVATPVDAVDQSPPSVEMPDDTAVPAGEDSEPASPALSEEENPPAPAQPEIKRQKAAEGKAVRVPAKISKSVASGAWPKINIGGAALGSKTSGDVAGVSKKAVVARNSQTSAKQTTQSEMAVIAPDLAEGNLNTLEVYSVKLAADMELTVPGSPGEFIVWIGAPEVEKRFDIGMVTDESQVPAVGETAQVLPHAPDFKVDPAESQCIKIHPSGSEVRFTLTPKETGTFEVGASVKLFESDDCSGAPVPKIVENLMVKVVVNEGKIVEQGLGELVKVAWEKFLEFWGALVALILGLLLFAVRGKFKKWFGFE